MHRALQVIQVPKGDVPDEFCCAASGRPLFYPVVTDQGVAYCYSVLFEMFMKAATSPKCAAGLNTQHFTQHSQI